MRGNFFLLNPRILAVTLLGFSSALPLALTSSTLQAWFTEAGLSLMAVGATSLIGLPYALKFLWSPFIDYFIPSFLGRRRSWVALTQVGLCISLFILSSSNPKTETHFIGLIALIIAFLSATQDIAIDAYRTDMLLPQERGQGLAYYIFAYRVALLVSGGLALILAGYIGWKVTYLLMALLMGLMAMLTYFAPEIPEHILPPKNFKLAAVSALKDLWERPAIILILLFVIFYKFGDALALSLFSNFLLRTLEFSLVEVGLAYKTIALIATIAGALLGGILLNRIGLYNALLYFGISQAFSNLMFMLLAIAGKHYLLMISAIGMENFCGGMSTVALLAFITTLCHQQYSATQFACLSALFAIGRIVAGPLASLLVTEWGWINFYALTFLICFPSFIILFFLRHKVGFHVKEAIA